MVNVEAWYHSFLCLKCKILLSTTWRFSRTVLVFLVVLWWPKFAARLVQLNTFGLLTEDTRIWQQSSIEDQNYLIYPRNTVICTQQRDSKYRPKNTLVSVVWPPLTRCINIQNLATEYLVTLYRLERIDQPSKNRVCIRSWMWYWK